MEVQRHRRVPGLRREELAQLAGVSVDYYRRLEQGRSTNASPVVLDAIARTLRLSETERAHLFDLANPVCNPTRCAPVAQTVRPATLQLLDTLDRGDTPAAVLGRYTNFLATNRLYRALLMWDDGPPQNRNLAQLTFLDESCRILLRNWDIVSGDVTAMLRFGIGRHPRDPVLNDLIEELLASSDAFRRLWANHNVHDRPSGIKHYHHPVAGDFSLNYQGLTLADPDQYMCVHTADPESPSAAALALLAKWARTRSSPP
ncbi:helix-turn-helix transcriptional regulator [Planotetraspora phitsanulokensis]|uniref:Transcriptional regulator n=2 Tax=Planotetraspora phitsanulokensis TaxID=575192 RepID=A0A8J3U8P4_9ACTN|nr:transcriptional regulator [Planotetraspora phitsanulokensis]